jgi:hypothetical protein
MCPGLEVAHVSSLNNLISSGPKKQNKITIYLITQYPKFSSPVFFVSLTSVSPFFSLLPRFLRGRVLHVSSIPLYYDLCFPLAHAPESNQWFPNCKNPGTSQPLCVYSFLFIRMPVLTFSLDYFCNVYVGLLSFICVPVVWSDSHISCTVVF